MTDIIAAPGPVGFLGLGAMGSGMAATLARNGFTVKAYDLSEERRREFEQATGQTAATSPTDALSDVAGVVLMLPDGGFVRRALLGEGDGNRPIAVSRPDMLIVDCSSCAPSDTQLLAADLRAFGFAMVDSPVSGGVPGTRAGTLTMMAGGPEDAVRRADAILRGMGRTVFHTGPSGSGHAMKTLVNYIGTSQMLLDFEALLIGQRFGLKPETMVEILNVSYAKNLSTEIVLAQQILSQRFAHNFSLALATKDARIAAETAEAVGFGESTPRHFARVLGDALETIGDTDLTRVYQYLDSLWGRQPVSSRPEEQP